jgi:hypothetical protein
MLKTGNKDELYTLSASYGLKATFLRDVPWLVAFLSPKPHLSAHLRSFLTVTKLTETHEQTKIMY